MMILIVNYLTLHNTGGPRYLRYIGPVFWTANTELTDK